MRLPDEAGTALSGIYVLLVEPHDDSRDILASVLQYCGASVLATPSAKEALARMELITPHVVLSALSMPEHDGRWLLGQLRARSGGDGIPTIVVTTNADVEDLLADGFRAVIAKPVDPDALCDAIRRVLSRPH